MTRPAATVSRASPTGSLSPSESDEFLEPRCGPYTLDQYHSRVSILRALGAALPLFHGTVLDVGCGQMPYRSLLLSAPSRATRYIGLELAGGYHARKPDLEWDGRRIPLPDRAVHCAVATEVLEHCPDPRAVLAEINRVLSPGGTLCLTVPFLWPLHDVPHDEYRYTPYSLRHLLEQSGYAEIVIEAFGGWDASLAQMLGLWVRRRPMRDLTRRLLQRLLMPVYRRLLARDQAPASFDQPVMITGLAAVARKPVEE